MWQLKENPALVIDAAEMLSAKRKEVVNCQEKEDLNSNGHMEHSYSFEDAHEINQKLVNQGIFTVNKLLQLLATSKSEASKLQKIIEKSRQLGLAQHEDIFSTRKGIETFSGLEDKENLETIVEQTSNRNNLIKLTLEEVLSILSSHLTDENLSSAG